MARNSAASIAVPASTFRIHAGSAPRAETTHPASVTNTAIPQTRSQRLRDRSRKHFNLHLLRPDVVGNVFRGHGQFVGSGTVCSGMTSCPELMPARASQLSATGKTPSSLATSVRVLCEALAFRLIVWPR